MDDFRSQNSFFLTPEFIKKVMPFGWMIFIVHGLYALLRIYNKIRYSDVFYSRSAFYDTLDWVFVAGSVLGVALGIRFLVSIDKAVKMEDPQVFEDSQSQFQGYLTFIAIFSIVQFLFNIVGNFF